jgi:hypothetical protein
LKVRASTEVEKPSDRLTLKKSLPQEMNRPLDSVGFHPSIKLGNRLGGYLNLTKFASSPLRIS